MASILQFFKGAGTTSPSPVDDDPSKELGGDNSYAFVSDGRTHYILANGPIGMPDQFRNSSGDVKTLREKWEKSIMLSLDRRYRLRGEEKRPLTSVHAVRPLSDEEELNALAKIFCSVPEVTQGSLAEQKPFHVYPIPPSLDNVSDKDLEERVKSALYARNKFNCWDCEPELVGMEDLELKDKYQYVLVVNEDFIRSKLNIPPEKLHTEPEVGDLVFFVLKSFDTEEKFWDHMNKEHKVQPGKQSKRK